MKWGLTAPRLTPRPGGPELRSFLGCQAKTGTVSGNRPLVTLTPSCPAWARSSLPGERLTEAQGGVKS